MQLPCRSFKRKVLINPGTLVNHRISSSTCESKQEINTYEAFGMQIYMYTDSSAVGVPPSQEVLLLPQESFLTLGPIQSGDALYRRGCTLPELMFTSMAPLFNKFGMFCPLWGPSKYEALHPYRFFSSKIWRWFVDTVFIQHRERFYEYLLESPSSEAVQHIVGLAHVCFYHLVRLHKWH